MAIYRFIYFSILSVYRRFSKDPQINIFAVGFFTVIIFFTILSLWGIYQYYALQQYELKPLFVIILGVSIFLFNTFYFLLNNERQVEYYESYCKQNNRYGLVAVGVYIFVVFALTAWIATKHREKNFEKKYQTSEIIQSTCSRAIASPPLLSDCRIAIPPGHRVV